MSQLEHSNEPAGLTRRGFLGRFTLGMAGIVGLGIPLKGLLAPARRGKGPEDGLPEDSIFRPRKDPRRNNGGSEKA